jgi:predicted transcriptional regulator
VKEDSIDLDTVLHLCRDRHRCIVLAVLADQQRTLTVNDLRNAVIKHNHHAPITETPTEVTTQIHIMLYHVHLPKLAETGVIEYDVDQQLVEPTAQFDELQPYLSTIIDSDPDLKAPVGL